ncbi:hypothetical protein DITRI_Ditri13aG0074500 [Diplodiscus trichospermus]
MAITLPLFSTSLLLRSLFIIASADNYSYDSSKNQPYSYVGKPQGEENLDYGNKLTPKGEEKHEYGTKPDFYKPKPEYKEKPDFYKPQPEEKKKTESSQEVEKPTYSTKPEEEKLPDLYSAKFEVLPIGVEGIVLCKSGQGYYPIQGALARITCLAVDENGYEKPHSVCSGETDAKGYFFATLSPVGLDDDQFTKLTECKAFLESSPIESCNVPVDVNKGISGAYLFDFRVLSQKGIKLYSVGPFFFTSAPSSVPNAY